MTYPVGAAPPVLTPEGDSENLRPNYAGAITQVSPPEKKTLDIYLVTGLANKRPYPGLPGRLLYFSLFET